MPSSFLTPSTAFPTSLLPSLLHDQKLTIVNLLRATKLKAGGTGKLSDEKWDEEATGLYVRARKKREKLERVGKEKEAKLQAATEKKQLKVNKRASEQKSREALKYLNRSQNVARVERAEALAAEAYAGEARECSANRAEFRTALEEKRRRKREESDRGREGLKKEMSMRAAMYESKEDTSRARERAAVENEVRREEKEEEEEARCYRQVMRLREEKEAKRVLILEQKGKVMWRKKEKFFEEVRTMKKNEELTSKREASLKKRAEEREERGSRREADRAALTDSRHRVLFAGTLAAFEGRSPPRREEEKKEKKEKKARVRPPAPTLEVTTPEKIRLFTATFSSPSGHPLTPKDFFSPPYFSPGVAAASDGTESQGTGKTEGTFRHSNVHEEGKVEDFFEGGPSVIDREEEVSGGGGDDGDDGDDGDEEGEADRSGAPGLVSHTKAPPPKKKASEHHASSESFTETPFPSSPPSSNILFPSSNILFPSSTSPLKRGSSTSPLKRGFSFAYTPSQLPSDADIEKMSPLQRTYTALKLKRGEDPAVHRMRQLIEDATG